MSFNLIVVGYSFVFISILSSFKFTLCQLHNDNPVQQEVANFAHETCQLETLNSKEFKTFYSVDKFFNKYGVMELGFRFMGAADGHIALTENTTNPNPRNASSYVISLGAYNNKISQIRRGHILEFKMNTPGILSENQYRGFVLRYNPNTGGIYVFSEGNDIPLLYLMDPNPLRINYFTFSTWDNRVIQVVFNCKAKDSYSAFVVNDPGSEDGNSSSRDKRKGLYFCL